MTVEEYGNGFEDKKNAIAVTSGGSAFHKDELREKESYWQRKGTTVHLYGSEDAQPNSLRFHIRDFPKRIQAAFVAMHKISNILAFETTM